MLYNFLMRKIPFIWLILALVFPPSGNAFPAMLPDSADQQPPCHEQPAGMDRQHGRQDSAAHDCCEQGAWKMTSQCCEHCPAPVFGLLIDVSLDLADSAPAPIFESVLSYPPRPASLPYKPPRA